MHITSIMNERHFLENMILKIKYIFLFSIITILGVTSYLSLVLCDANANSNIDISLTVDKTTIHEDEEFKLSVNLKTIGNNSNINLPMLDIPGLENFQIIQTSSSSNINIINGESQSIINQNKIITPSKIGKFILGPVKIKYKDPSTNKNTIIESNSIEITVKKMIITKNGSDKNKVKTNIDYLSIILVLITILLIYLFVWFKKKQKEKISIKRNEEINVVFPKTKDIDFFDKTLQILRFFLQEKVGLKNTSSTTQEILEALDKKKYYKKQQVKILLNEMDKNKFAKSEINKTQIIKILKQIIS